MAFKNTIQHWAPRKGLEFQVVGRLKKDSGSKASLPYKVSSKPSGPDRVPQIYKEKEPDTWQNICTGPGFIPQSKRTQHPEDKSSSTNFHADEETLA